jgi:hypothetical protein
MNDRDLLILAAKAAGYWAAEFNCPANLPHKNWNPLTDDGDALRLAVKLRMVIDTDYNGGANAGNAAVDFGEPEYGYQEGQGKPAPLAATRRAIVRAAAEIGEGMK